MDKPWLLSLNDFSWDVNPICNISQSCKHVKDRESLYIQPMDGEFSSPA